MHSEAVFQIKTTDEGEVWHELLNCHVKIARRIAVDLGDGSPVGTTHVDLVARHGGEVVELPRVEWESFRKGEYLRRLPWALVWRDTPQGRSILANAITTMSGPVPVVTAFGTLGWRETPAAGWVYAHAGGGIGAGGDVPGVEVEVSPRLGGFRLPTPPAEAGDVAAALRGVLAVLEELPPRIAAPALAAPFRAMAGETRSSVFLVGHTGSRKSGVAALAQQVHYPRARHNRLPVGAGEAATTTTAMEELLWQAADALLVADDLAPDRGSERAGARANELLRMVGNGSPKARGARGGGLREDRPPRALLMLTGEDGASRPSAESRTVYVKLGPGDVPLDVIRALSAPELVRGRNVMGAVVARHLAARMPVEEWAEATRETYAAALLAGDPDPDGLASRRADAVADLAVGWRVLLDAALDAGALTPAAAGEVWARAWAGLAECLARQSELVDRRSLVERSADLLRSALRSGRAHLQAQAGGAPGSELHATCGWVRGETSFGDLKPSGEAAGWTDGQLVWLDPGSAFAVIERQARAESDPLGVTARALTGALLAAGVLATEEVSGRSTPVPQVRRRCAGARQRVWELPWSWLWPDEVDEAGDDPGPGGDPDGPHDGGPTLPPAPPFPAGSSPTHPGPAAESPAEPRATPLRSVSPVRPVEGRTEPFSAPQESGAPAASTSRSVVGPAPRAAGAGYRAPAVVADVDAAVLVGAGPVEVPDVDTLPALVQWADALALGTAHARSRDDAGQVWIMPALARRLGLKTVPKKETRRATELHPAVRALRAAGWEVGRLGLQPWTRVWPAAGGPGLQLVVVPWLQEDVPIDPKTPGTPGDVADRLEMFSGLVQVRDEPVPWLWSAATTGTSLLKQVRATARSPLTVVDPPPPAEEDRGRRWEQDLSWTRCPDVDELRRRHVVAWDVNAQYLAAAAVVQLGVGSARHVERPAVPDSPSRLRPGYWRVPGDAVGDPRLPNLFHPMGERTTTGPVWVATPTFALALELGLDVTPTEAWLWDEHTRWMEEWSHTLRDARYALDGALVADPDDAAARAVSRAVKLTYAAGIGMLGSEQYRKGTELYRPDARHHVIAMAKANLIRKCVKAAGAGRAPLAIHRDCLLFASDSDDPQQAPPAGFTSSQPGQVRRLGEVKWAGAARLADIVDELRAGDLASVIGKLT